MAEDNENAVLQELPAIDQGTVIQVTDAGGGLKYISRFVGLDSQVIITRLPPVTQLKKSGMGTDELTFRDTFFSKRKLVMRMISNGRVFAFETDVVDVFLQGGKLLMSTYPKHIQSRMLRKEPRYPCAIPGDLTVGEQAYSGIMVNFSTGGGLFKVTSQTEFEALQKAREEQQKLTLKLQLPFDEQPSEINVQLMSITTADQQLGFSFSDGKELIQRYIAALKLDSISDFF